MTKQNDQSFDTLMNKFANNIYGSSKGKLRHELLLAYLDQVIGLASPQRNVIDVGGGTGIMCEEMAKLSHRVHYNDLSADAVAFAQHRLRSYAQIKYSQGRLLSIDDERTYDLVLCHAVLEWLENPFTAIDKLLDLTADDGYLSLSFFNRDAHRFGNMLYGNFDYVKAGMRNKNTVRLNPKNSLEPKTVLDYLAEKDVQILHCAGIRCIHDYMQDRSMQQSHYAQILENELIYGPQEPYKWLGKYFHIIARKNPV